MISVQKALSILSEEVFDDMWARRWASLLFKVGIAQAIVQAVQIGTGIWIIRLASKTEYGYYTIANTLFFSLMTLADSGVTASLWASGGRAWHDSLRLGRLLRSALILRRHLALIVAGGVIPLLVGLLLRNGVPLRRAIVFGGLVSSVIFGELTTHTYMVIFRLRSQFRFTQGIALLGALVRVLWLAPFLLGHLTAEVAFMASAVNTSVQWFLLRRRIGDHAVHTTLRDPETERETWNVIRRQMPLNIYYCLQGQIAVWLASTFGSVHEVSDIGALGRFGALFTVGIATMQEVVLPAFAKTQSPEAVKKRYFQIAGGYCGVLAFIVALVTVFSHPTLAILGSQYSQLATELMLAVSYAALAALVQVLWALNYSRAWIISPIPYISVTLVLQMGLAANMDIRSVRGILLFSIVSLLPALVFPFVLTMRKIRLLEESSAVVLAEAQSV
jgi:hypothetical protein